jgi:hypothetical protein
MIDVEIVKLGHIDNKVDLSEVKKHRSRLYRVSSITCRPNLPEPEHDRLTIVEALTDDQIASIMGAEGSAIRIGIIDYYLEGNYYVRILGDKTVVVSIKVVKDVLPFYGVSIETFIIKSIYEIITIFHEVNNGDPSNAYSIPHTETRGCLFDMNGEVTDVIYNTETPIICSECRARLERKELPQGYLSILQKELATLKKPILKRLEIFVRRYPLVSLLMSFLFSVFINILSNCLFSIMKTLMWFR